MRIGYLSLTTRCPNRCIACPCVNNNATFGELSVDEVKRAVELADQHGGADQFILSGGEPTLHTRFLEIMGYLATKSFSVSLTTTSQRFADRDFLNKLLDVYPVERLKAATSLHSFDPLVHDRMTNTEGSFYAWYTGLRQAGSAGIAITLKHLISKPTHQAIPSFVQCYYEQFEEQVPLLICGLDFSGKAARHKEAVFVPFHESRPYLEEALSLVAKRKSEGDDRKVTVFDVPYCAVGSEFWPYLYTTADDDRHLVVYHAPDVPEGKPLTRVPQRSGVTSAGCVRCKVRGKCSGAWGSAFDVVGEDSLVPVE